MMYSGFKILDGEITEEGWYICKIKKSGCVYFDYMSDICEILGDLSAYSRGLQTFVSVQEYQFFGPIPVLMIRNMDYKLREAEEKLKKAKRDLGEEVDTVHKKNDVNLNALDYLQQHAKYRWCPRYKPRISGEKPEHYKDLLVDVIDFCLWNKIPFAEGNVIKYVVRAGKKKGVSRLEDLEKAKAYIERMIQEEQRGLDER